MTTYARMLASLRNALRVGNYSNLMPRGNKFLNFILRPSKKYSRFTTLFITSSIVASRSIGWFSKSDKTENSTSQIPKPTPDQIAMEESDKLYQNYQIEGNYKHLMKFKDSQNENLLWRLARAIRDFSQLEATSPEDKRHLTYEALEVAKRALDINDSNYACHKWYAICLSDVGDYEGAKIKISNAFIIREHFEKAIKLNPKDATSVHLIGLWCYTFADMPWYQLKIASVLFATPPSSSFEEALKYFELAEQTDPNFYSRNLLYLGMTHLKLGDKEKAKQYLERCKDSSARKTAEFETQKKAEDMLKSL